MPPAKPTFDKYANWLKDTLSIEVNKQVENLYEIVATSIQTKFYESDFWQPFVAHQTLRAYDEEYRLRHSGYPLLLDREYQPPRLVTKPFASLLAKTYRMNVLDNRRWPNPPKWFGQEGWFLPENWFIKVNDVLRTCFVVKYFDGVRFLADKLKQLGSDLHLRIEESMQARDEGYYAAHLYVYFDVEVVTRTLQTEIITAQVELQITTQLQEVIRQMSHLQYEERRMSSERDDRWKWDHTSREFATNYLGHILHYLEGMILEIRDRPKES